jgi:hypothetical protein
MKRLLLLGVSLLACTGAFAQRGGGGGGARGGGGNGGGGSHGGGGYSGGGYVGGVRQGQPGTGYGFGTILNPSGTAPGSTYGYGNIIYPGGVTAFPNGINNQGAGPPPLGLGGGRGYGGGYSGYGRGGGHGGGRNQTIVVPYAVPVWTGYGYSDYGYGYDGDQPAPNVSVVVPQQPTPQVIINQGYTPDVARPVLKDYSDAELPETSPTLRVYEAPTLGRTEAPPTQGRRAAEPSRETAPADDRPTIFLIALKDSSVRAAIGFWAQGSTLNYVTPQGDVNHLSLDMLDRPTTDQLNHERGLEFELKTVY